MLNAGTNFLLLWKRVVAALSLVAAAALAPSAAAPIGGSGLVGSRAGHGPALANAANALIASVDAVIEGGRQVSPPGDRQADETDGHGRRQFGAVWQPDHVCQWLPIHVGSGDTIAAIHEQRVLSFDHLAVDR